MPKNSNTKECHNACKPMLAEVYGDVLNLYIGKDDKWVNLEGMYFFVFHICLFYYMLEVIELVKER